MEIWRGKESKSFEPDGHFGGLAVTDVVTRDIGDNFVIQGSVIPPGGGGHSHSHEDDIQVFIVVKGQMTYDNGEEKVTLHANEAVTFLCDEPHASLNEGDSDTSVFVVTVRQ